MAGALYGTGGFFTRAAEGPADHFRTSVHASPLFASALLRLIRRVDSALGRPDRLDVVDVGAGRGELLAALRALVNADPAAEVRGLGVVGGRPALDLARTDPAGYLRALSAAGAAAELTDPAGLGGHWWLLHEVGIELRGTMLP